MDTYQPTPKPADPKARILAVLAAVVAAATMAATILQQVDCGQPSDPSHSDAGVAGSASPSDDSDAGSK